MTGYLLTVRPAAGGYRVTNAADEGLGNVVARMGAAPAVNKHVKRKLALGLYATEAEAGRVLAWLTGGAFPEGVTPLPEADDDGPQAFAVRLRESRSAAGLSVPQLAEAAGLTRQAVYQYEAGDRRPTWDAVQSLAKALGVPTDHFRDA